MDYRGICVSEPNAILRPLCPLCVISEGCQLDPGACRCPHHGRSLNFIEAMQFIAKAPGWWARIKIGLEIERGIVFYPCAIAWLGDDQGYQFVPNGGRHLPASIPGPALLKADWEVVPAQKVLDELHGRATTT